MWNCPKCGERIDDVFDACWKCGTAQDGTLPADFQVEPGNPETHDPRAETDQPGELAADSAAAAGGLKNERIVELCAAASAVEAHALCALFEEAGIRCRIVGETLGNAAGGLPLGETIAPRIWVREEDAARAREIIDEQARGVGWQWSPLAEENEQAELDTASEEGGTPRVSDVRSRRLGRGLSLIGAACILLGAALAWHNWMTWHKYTAAAEGVAVQYQKHYSFDSRPTSDLPVPRAPAFSVWYEVQYAFVVNGKTYYSVDPHCQRLVWRIPVHYDPRDPAANIRGTLTSPWSVLAFALATGGVLLLAGYALARTGRGTSSGQQN
jgi:hypothetical protein